MTFTVYGLIDVREPWRVRYVGVTDDLTRRLSEHLSNLGRATPERAAWFRQNRPHIAAHVFATVSTSAAARVVEWKLIRDLRGWGECDLNSFEPAPRSLDREIRRSFMPFDSYEERCARFWA